MSKLDFYDSEIFVDYYETMDIDPSVSIEDIKQSYIELVKKHHPDQGGSEAMFRKVNEAYEILSNDGNRKEYDAYYIKKNTDAFNIDEFARLKNDHSEYVEDNKKDLSEEEIEKLYNDVILSIQQENKQVVDDELMTGEDMLDKIDDLQYERRNAEDEETNDKLHNLLDEMNNNRSQGHPMYTVSDLFEFYKYKNKNNSNGNGNNQQLLNNNFMSLNEINNPNDMGFSFVDDGMNNLNSSFYSFYGEQHSNDKANVANFINTIDENEFSEWNLNKNEEEKVTENDFEKLLQQRRDVENEIDHTIEQNLEKHKTIMNLVDDGEQFADNLNFFQNYKNPFENDLYGAVEQNIDELNNNGGDNSVNDINNINGTFKTGDIDVDNNLKEVKSFIKKTNKAKHEQKDTNIKENDIAKLINERKNIDSLIFDDKTDDQTVPKKHKNLNITNVIKRKSKSEINAAKESHGIDMKKYEVTSGSNSKFKDLVKANANDKLEKNLGLNLEDNLGDIRDFYA
jgi:curved DNA-binding protein CbpA